MIAESSLLNTNTSIVKVTGLANYLDGRFIHKDISFTITKGEIVALIGGSGSGKTTLLRSMLMLRPPTAGQVNVFGIDVYACSVEQALMVKQRWGVLFQMNALFSSLTILENIMFPMVQHADLNRRELEELAALKIKLVGLDLRVASQYPAELSGGMQKRAALARAIALDPELIFLDEPTAGLDPASAAAIDDLVIELRAHLGLTFVIATHDLDTLWRVPDNVMFLGDGHVLARAPLQQLVKMPQPLIQKFFSGYRGHLRREET